MKNKILVLDIETTGLDTEKDEILSISIIDAYENVLYNSYFCPERTEEWLDAEKVHHISWDDVLDAPTLTSELDYINEILSSAYLLVGYNLESFDLPFLKNNGAELPGCQVVDVMECFSGIYGDWNDMHGQFRWKKLTDCAAYYGYNFHAHDSLEDVKATLFCYKEMISKACQISKIHRSCFENWEHGNPVAYTRDRSGNHIVVYEDGKWWHYSDDGESWW